MEGLRLSQTVAFRFFAILPRHIVVFVLMPGSGSLAVFARYFNSSPFMIRSLSFETIVSIDLTVCSRNSGA